MVFSSLTFLCVFFPVVFLLTLLLPGIRAKNILLAVCSLLFYAYGEPVYVVLMVLSTILNWLFGMWIGRCRTESRDAGRAPAGTMRCTKLLLILAVMMNLAFLGWFKYAGLFVETINSILGSNIAEPEISLPIGISFYTFQAMSYVIDVYRGEVRAQKNYLKILIYISFFPQLIAGPIVKYHEIEKQLDCRTITLTGAAEGFRRFCFGLARKVLISNTMGIAADAIFGASFSEINIAGAWVGAISYVLQIYFDFSGYSDMAIGMANMFGFSYRENFRYPYAAATIKEFWRRWHISLSTWLKEYLYIPLGGSRKGRGRTVVNKVIVFFCCGLWHGASWTFVVWGLVHGFFSLLEEYLPVRKLPKALGWLYTMLVVTLAFVIFRADTIAQGFTMIGRMFAGFQFDAAATSLVLEQLTPLYLVTLAVAVPAAMPIAPALCGRAKKTGHALAWDNVCYAAAFVLFALSFLSLAGGGYNPFIYFRF